MKEENKRIHRVEKTKDYSVICNHGLRDEELSWGAKGLLAHMLTRPDDWDFHNEELAKHSPESVKVIKKLISELKSKGYVKRIRILNDKTKQVEKWETVLYEKPKIPDAEEPGEEKPDEEPEDQKPEGGNGTSGQKPMDTPEVPNPPSGKPGSLESHSVEKVPILNTDSKPNTDIQTIPVREQKPLPELQKATALLFKTLGGKKELSEDDRISLNLLFDIHTPAAIQSEFIKAFDRLKKNGSVKVLFTDNKEYTVTKKERLPVRYIYNCMKNWSSLRNTGKGGAKSGQSRANPGRAQKDYEKQASAGFFR